MIMAATRTSMLTETEVQTRSDLENLPGLLSRLSNDVMELLSSQLALLKVEIREEASTYAQGAIVIGIGAVIAAIGFALLNAAIAFGVSILFARANFSQPASYALGFVITGFFYLLVGSIVLAVIKSRLSQRRLVPLKTVTEMRKDREWLKNEL
jgi:uncharacterized membrane protein YqjE